MARPRAGDWLADEIAHWCLDGIGTVVSLLESHEISDLELFEEAALCRANGMSFLEFSIPDRGVPDSGVRFDALVAELATSGSGGGAVAVHCRAGIGRSSLVAACVLIEMGFRAGDALGMLEAAPGSTCA